MEKYCDCCEEHKQEFCDECELQVMKDDGLLVNICKECCQCENKKEDK